MIRPASLLLGLAFATLSLAPFVSASAHAADISAWDGDSRSTVRLIAAKADGAVLRAGIEIKLAPGWKTYWRYPGDAGVPPQFDFSRSDNLAKAEVLWPAPLRFSDGEGNTIGYKDDVILPVHIEAADKSRPVVLRVALDYAVCEKLCVPAQAKAELPLQEASPASDAAIAEAEQRVPRPAILGARAPLSIASVKRESGSRVSVDVVADAPVTLFAEGPTSDWALPLPEPAEGAPAGQKRFTFALDGLPPGGKPDGAILKLTAVSAGRAIETTFRLD
jgi:DsbC/DsbD-like thiol-disulfide interchange protein